MKHTGHSQAATRLATGFALGSSRISNHRAQPATMPASASGVCVSSISNWSFTLAMAWLCVSSNVPPPAQSSGNTSAALRICFATVRTRHSKIANTSDQHDEEAMLQHFHVAEAFEEADIAERPDFGIGTEEQEDGEPEEQQRPVARPAQAGLIEQRQQTDRETNSPDQ